MYMYVCIYVCIYVVVTSTAVHCCPEAAWTKQIFKVVPGMSVSVDSFRDRTVVPPECRKRVLAFCMAKPGSWGEPLPMHLGC